MKVMKRKLPAGWYPTNESNCIKAIKDFLARENDRRKFSANVGCIVPHAGWAFSGKLACRTIAVLSSLKPDIVVVIGGHLGPGVRPTVYIADEWETPLGNIPMDQEFINAIQNKIVMMEESEFEIDNTVEVQLPFVKYFFPTSKMVGFRSPMSSDAIELGEEIVALAKEQQKQIILIGSIDLTHYGPNYNFTPKGIGKEAVKWVKEVNDKEFIEYTLGCKPRELLQHAIKNRSSCSPGPAATVVGAALHLGIQKGQLYDYYTSYDIRSDANLVGYAGIVF